MTIKEAKQEIKNALTAYRTRDKLGQYMIPIEKQRPVFLMGPPGIGKTAIMEQIAGEMGIGLLSYSMTHHTRQSALGLPVIKNKVYAGKEYEISEYTMSEIIASVYDMMEETGVKEGILFLDEVNCVSETLTPVMLQFLQYKVFGRHQVPEGWTVVTAGNPPEYNNSVREFDIVTWDRLKRIDIEPDRDAWKEYAAARGLHPAIISYIEVRPDNFYKVETKANGKSFATARGWEDLSKMIQLYELNNIAVTYNVIAQYIQDTPIAHDFAAYYELFKRYRGQYEVPNILAGHPSGKVRKQAQDATFDERVALIGILIDAVGNDILEVMDSQKQIRELDTVMRDINLSSARNGLEKSIETAIDSQNSEMDSILKAKNAGSDKAARIRENIAILSAYRIMAEEAGDDKAAESKISADLDKRKLISKERVAEAGDKLTHMIEFLEDVYGDGQEMLLAITRLTTERTADFLAIYGNDAYMRHNKDLMFFERQKDIREQLSNLNLNDIAI